MVQEADSVYGPVAYPHFAYTLTYDEIKPLQIPNFTILCGGTTPAYETPSLGSVEDNQLHLGPDGANQRDPALGWNTYATINRHETRPLAIAISINPKSTSTQKGLTAICQTLYVDGKLTSDSWYWKDNWDTLKKYEEELQYFTIGLSSLNSAKAFRTHENETIHHTCL